MEFKNIFDRIFFWLINWCLQTRKGNSTTANFLFWDKFWLENVHYYKCRIEGLFVHYCCLLLLQHHSFLCGWTFVYIKVFNLKDFQRTVHYLWRFDVFLTHINHEYNTGANNKCDCGLHSAVLILLLSSLIVLQALTDS